MSNVWSDSSALWQIEHGEPKSDNTQSAITYLEVHLNMEGDEDELRQIGLRLLGIVGKLRDIDESSPLCMKEHKTPVEEAICNMPYAKGQYAEQLWHFWTNGGVIPKTPDNMSKQAIIDVNNELLQYDTRTGKRF